MDEQELSRNLRLNDIFMPSASKERRSMFERQGVEFGPTAKDLHFVHYTSADAAVKILRTKRLWMRNAKCMADYGEVHHGYELLRKFFSDEKERLEFHGALEAAAPGIAKETFARFDEWWGQGNLGLNVFIASLSEHDRDKENDLGRLSMWRAFGSAHEPRVALVLKVQANTLAATTLNMHFSPVSYLSEANVAQEMRDVANNIVESLKFLRSLEPQLIMNHLFFMLYSAVTCFKHEAFREEREWRAVYSPQLFGGSDLIKGEVETVGGLPQHVYKIPLDKSASPGLEALDVSQLIERVIIGPTPYPWTLYQAFVEELKKADVPNADERVHTSAIPLR